MYSGLEEAAFATCDVALIIGRRYASVNAGKLFSHVRLPAISTASCGMNCSLWRGYTVNKCRRRTSFIQRGVLFSTSATTRELPPRVWYCREIFDSGVTSSATD